MKRLLTIFLTSILGVGLCTQAQSVSKVPMTILGDVYIDNTGIMKSEGAVHVKAIDTDKVGRVDNYGNLILQDSIIFYTNDEVDGLLRNGYTSLHNSTVKSADASNLLIDPVCKVVVSKNFKVHNRWYTMALPFEVDLTTGIRNPLNGAILTLGTDFQVQYYNAEKRAQSGLHGEQNWEVLPSGTKIMERGKAYRFVVRFDRLDPNGLTSPKTGGYDVEFIAKSTDVNTLFSKDDKGINLVYNPIGTGLLPGPDVPEYHRVDVYNSDGWNVIGGLNTDDFEMLSGGTIEYNRAIYFVRNEGTAWEEYYPSDPKPNFKGVLRPYGAIFVKIPSSYTTTFTRGLVRNQGGYGGFSYYFEGNTIDNAKNSSLVMFRSAQDVNYDLFRLDMLDSKDGITSTYFKFNKNYSSFYKADEDNISFSMTDINMTKAWSLAKIQDQNFSNRLFVNSLPYNKQEIPIGVNIQQAGEYIFSMKHLTANEAGEIESIILWDKVEDIKIELLQSDYKFKSTSGLNSENRFVLFLNSDDVTGLDKMPDVLDIYAYTENNILTVRNLQSGDRVQVMDLTGRTIVIGVASGNMFKTPLNQKGIYLVNIKGEKTLKVLNK